MSGGDTQPSAQIGGASFHVEPRPLGTAESPQEDGRPGRSTNSSWLTVFLFQRHAKDDHVMRFELQDDAERVMDVPRKGMGRFGLTLHPDKTCLLPFRRRRIQQAHLTWERGRGRDGPSSVRTRAAPPRTNPRGRNYRTGLLPRVRTSKRSSGQGCSTRAGGIHRCARAFVTVVVGTYNAIVPPRGGEGAACRTGFDDARENT